MEISAGGVTEEGFASALLSRSHHKRRGWPVIVHLDGAVAREGQGKGAVGAPVM